jgi:DUF4097 and DUF4098 domain-containing protein YvlB
MTVEKTYENVRNLAVDIRVPSGHIEVDGRAVDTVELSIVPQNDSAREVLEAGGVTVDFRERGDGHELLVDVRERRGLGWLGRGPQFDVRVICPEQSRVSAKSGSADFEGRGTLGALELKTASGDVDVHRVDGPVTAHSASGDVEVEHAVGPVEVNTASGDITLGTVARALRANLVSGDLSVREAAESVKVNSVSGDLQVEAVQRGKIELQSVSGDIEVGVRRGTDVWMDVRSVSGDMHSSLTPTEGPGSGDADVVELRIKSVSGDVRIDHAPAAVT